ncbi:hypothetical protein [Streptomyces sp. NPDC004267]|uniref:hypothetical protein n=1 Tax=Streptomyces sp. NPDC004267 TaxID=3364694 RepID=UPI0036AB3487
MTITHARRLMSLRSNEIRKFASKIVADPRLTEAALAKDKAQFDAAFDEFLRDYFPGLKVNAVKEVLGDVHTAAYRALEGRERPPVTRRDRRATRIISAAVHCLPPCGTRAVGGGVGRRMAGHGQRASSRQVGLPSPTSSAHWAEARVGASRTAAQGGSMSAVVRISSRAILIGVTAWSRKRRKA